MKKKKEELNKDYFIEALFLIRMVALNYDGYSTNNASSMKRLVDRLNKIAGDALDGKPLYWGIDKNGKDKPIWDPITTEDNPKIYKKI